MAIVDLQGKIFGRLKVIKENGRSKYMSVTWLCKCTCGKLKHVNSKELIQGHTRSCGCLRSEMASIAMRKTMTTHGLSHTKAYRTTKDANRRGMARNNGGTFTELQVKKLYKTQKGLCAACKKKLKYSAIHRDHIMPISLGGRNDIGNIQILCARCNLTKSNKHPIRWANENGKLF